ncbi:MAG: hypothetical protein LBQ52_07610 [Helicobacteraceae bacterium]|jgi:hypothetical protein|nr:hypothetical protein [Helicobacteraceae bacterium]
MTKRAMSSEQARNVRAAGHADAKLFAKIIGLPNDYNNDLKAKKDVIDHNGDAHSVKSGKEWWQIFLYSRSRIESDYAFKAMNGIGQLIIECLDIFTQERSDYLKDKEVYKRRLEKPMIEIREKLGDKKRLEAFLAKAFFNGNEVQFLTVKESNCYHVFYYKDVINILSAKLNITNSKALCKGQFNNQKVLFQLNGVNAGELELRNDSDIHYREIKLRLNKHKIFNVLRENITDRDNPAVINRANIDNRVVRYAQAIKKFKP